MTLRTRGDHRYGDRQSDVRQELARWSRGNGYAATRFADAHCALCGGVHFRLALDEDAGVAVRTCAACGEAHAMADGADFLDDAELEECACPCGNEELELTLGAALYADGETVRWLYVGARCPACGLVGVYGEWKNEHDDAGALLANA